jgi:hypothetical protein
MENRFLYMIWIFRISYYTIWTYEYIYNIYIFSLQFVVQIARYILYLLPR